MKRKIRTQFEYTLAKQQLEKLQRKEREFGKLSIGSDTLKNAIKDAINAYEQRNG